MTQLSSNYSCHAWLADPSGRFVICTDQGQILLLNSQGEYKGENITAPGKENFPITAITTFSGVTQQDPAAAASGAMKPSGAGKSGFIVAGASGYIRVFVKSDVDPKKPYVRVDTSDNAEVAQYANNNNPSSQMVIQDIDIHKITSISLDPQENTIVFTNNSS